MHNGIQKSQINSWISPAFIAVATDLMDLEYLLPHAKAQATAAGGATLWLVHVIPPQAYVSPASGSYPFVPRERVYRDAEEVLAKEAAQLRKEGFSCDFEIRRWYEAEEIAAFVRERRIDRLIIGTSGKGKLGRFLLGSVAEKLIRTVDIPVCTIGPHVGTHLEQTAHGILYATSLHHEAEASLQYAISFAETSKRNLTVLHVVEHGPAHSMEAFDARVMMDYLMSRVTEGRATPHVILRFGDPRREILREAEAIKPELIVLGAVPSSNLAAMIQAGVAYEVITKASCPVLTIRESSCALCRVRRNTDAADPAHAELKRVKG